MLTLNKKSFNNLTSGFMEAKLHNLNQKCMSVSQVGQHKKPLKNISTIK